MKRGWERNCLFVYIGFIDDNRMAKFSQTIYIHNYQQIKITPEKSVLYSPTMTIVMENRVTEVDNIDSTKYLFIKNEQKHTSEICSDIFLVKILLPTINRHKRT